MSDPEILRRLEEVPEPVPDATYVVIDVIMSSTTIVHLLENGASYVHPFYDEAEARGFEEQADDALLVGEDGGDPIEGFLSPLPTVLRQEDLHGRPVGILTTNGTRAVHRIGRSEGVLVGSTVNAAAVADHLRDVDGDIYLVAAGRFGREAPEDTVGAELIQKRYRGEDLREDERREFEERLRNSETAEWLTDLGFANEIEGVLDFDSSTVVPRMRDGVFVS